MVARDDPVVRREVAVLGADHAPGGVLPQRHAGVLAAQHTIGACVVQGLEIGWHAPIIEALGRLKARG